MNAPGHPLPSAVEPLLAVVTKEYEGLRKEIDARTDATRTYGWPVILVAFTALAAFKVDNIDWDLILLFIPTAGMTIAALAANASYDMDRISRALAVTEDKIFILTGRPLLTYESRRVYGWGRTRADFYHKRAVIISILYLGFQYWLYAYYLPAREAFAPVAWRVYPGRALVLWGIIVAPLFMFYQNSRRRSALHAEPFFTTLIDEMVRSESLDPTRGRLMYNYGGAGPTPPPETH
jgi:hypothetical protein